MLEAIVQHYCRVYYLSRFLNIVTRKCLYLREVNNTLSGHKIGSKIPIADAWGDKTR